MITTKLSARLSGKLSVRLYKNHSGTVSWRVCGMMHGERIRRNFKDKADALAEKRSIEIRLMQDTSGLRLVGTFLTDPQLREAEALFLRLQSLCQQQEEQAQQAQQERQWVQNPQQAWRAQQPQQPLQQEQQPSQQRVQQEAPGQWVEPQWPSPTHQHGQPSSSTSTFLPSPTPALQASPTAPSSPKPSPLHSLTFCVDYALAHYEEPVSDKSLAEAQREYCQQREADHAKELLTGIHLASIKSHMERLDEMFPGIAVSELDAEKITRFCEQGGAAWKTHNNRRNLVSAFLKFAEKKKWITAGAAEELLAKVPRYDTAHKRGSAPALTAEKTKELMAFLEGYEGGRLVPHYALLLFAGIRPDINNGEISKLRPTDIRLNYGAGIAHGGGGKKSRGRGNNGAGRSGSDDYGVIHVEPEVSKVDMKRRVTILPNLHAWLTAYPLEKYPLIMPGLTRHRAAIAKKFGLTPDILRHTFISMHVAKFRSMGDTALQAGNSEQIIRKHYLDVKSPAEAAEFFAIIPKLGKGNHGVAAAGTKPTKAAPAALAAPAAASKKATAKAKIETAARATAETAQKAVAETMQSPMRSTAEQVLQDAVGVSVDIAPTEPLAAAA